MKKSKMLKCLLMILPVLVMSLLCVACKEDPHVHSFSEQVAEEQFLASPANCQNVAKYYKSCKCGAKSKETFKYGDTGDHIWSETWTGDYACHWHACTVRGCEVEKDLDLHDFNSDGICTVCSAEKASDGMKYTMAKDRKSYVLNSIDKCVDRRIVVPSTYKDLPVTGIGVGAFYMSNIITVKLPDTITSIGNNAFASCESLTTINFGSKLETIGFEAFSGSNALANISISEENPHLKLVDGHVYSKDDTTFVLYAHGKTETEYVIKEGTTTIAQTAFSGNASLKSITVPNSVTTIEKNAFASTQSLEKVTLSESLTEIAPYLFAMSTKLNNVNIPEGVTIIKENAFFHCEGLISITLPSSVLKINEQAFAYAGMRDFGFNEGLTTIGKSAFAHCPNLRAISLPDTVTFLGKGAFNACEAVRTLKLSNGLTEIAEQCFLGNKSLQNVVIPDSVTVLRELAFGTCMAMTNATLPKNLTTIENSAFNTTGLISITLPSTLTSIGDSAFYSCDELKSVTIPGSVTAIPNNCFAKCWDMESVTIENGVKSIGVMAFSECHEIFSLTIPDSVETIGDYAISTIEKLTILVLGSGIKSIGDKAIYNLPALESISYRGTVESWEQVTLAEIWLAGGGQFLKVREMSCTDGKITLPRVYIDFFGGVHYE